MLLRRGESSTFVFEGMAPAREVELHQHLIALEPVSMGSSDGALRYADQDEAAAFLGSLGFSLPDEAEIEHLLRIEARDELLPFPLDCDTQVGPWMSLQPGASYPETDTGAKRLFVGDLTREVDANIGPIAKAGAAQFWPWQHEEWVWCLPEFRFGAREMPNSAVPFRAVFRLSK